MILRSNIVVTLSMLLLTSIVSEPAPLNTLSLKDIANISYAGDNIYTSGSSSMFSPRMDFDQWKPLTGRGDPLRNDPTYDYEPPVLERVHYWADDTRLEREHYPERKSEVLMLGVSSRKPSVAPRQPQLPRRQHRPPSPPKYEDFTYKLSDHYPMTILVPPPLPPPGHKAPLYVLSEEKLTQTTQTQPTELPPLKQTTIPADHYSSLYALQEANLIYQSSTTSQNWIVDYNDNDTISIPNSAVSSDYAGWGPTTPLENNNDVYNETQNFISQDHLEPIDPYSFYKPILSESPPPPKSTGNPLLLPTFIPTALPPIETTETTQATMYSTKATWSTDKTKTEILTTENIENDDNMSTDKQTANGPLRPPLTTMKPKTENNVLNMLGPMMTMPLINGPERQEDNLYAHASENIHIFKNREKEDVVLETMQTMQPPPTIKPIEDTTTLKYRPPNLNMEISQNAGNKEHTLDPYLNMRFTTPLPETSEIESDNTRSTTVSPIVPMYLIIQGHSKVKTYGSKPKLVHDNDTINNEISRPNETTEVKHLHPIKEKYVKKSENGIKRTSRAQHLKSLVDSGLGSIEIQATDLGIKYDVSDGSEVPLEVYRKGIVDSDENDYSSNKSFKNKRTKRQMDLEDFLPFDEDTLEEYVYNYINKKRNDSGITGLIAQAITSKAADVIDDIESEDDDEDKDR